MFVLVAAGVAAAAAAPAHAHGRGGWGWGWGWGWSSGWYGWPGYYGMVGSGWYGYPYGYPSVVLVQQPAPAANPAPPSGAPWRYCPDSGQFYPHASECASAWQNVPMGAPVTPP